MDKWNNIEDLVGYEVNEGEHGFTGRLIDKNGDTISILGMAAHNIGFSFDRETTEMITKKEYDETSSILSKQ